MHQKFRPLLIIFLLVVFFACHKYDALQKSIRIDEASVKDWFQKYGGAYKSGIIAVGANEGAVKARLDWSNAKRVFWQNKSYLDIPYIFSDGSRYTRYGNAIAPTAFNLVVRIYENGGYRAALRSTTRETDMLRNGKIVQTYTLIKGGSSNIWLWKENNNKHQEAIAVQRLNITHAEFLQLKQQEEAQKEAAVKAQTRPRATTGGWYDGDGCWVEEHTTYSGNCNYYIGEMVVVKLCKHTSYTRDCPPNGEEPPVSPEGGGHGGGGGGAANPPQDPCSGSAPPPYDPSLPPPSPNEPDNNHPDLVVEPGEYDPCNPYPPVEPDEPVPNPIDCITLSNLKKIFPNTPDAQLQEVIDQIKEYARDFDIDSKAKLNHLIAQMGHETENFTRYEENRQFRVEKLSETWGALFNPVSNPTKDPAKANPNDFRESPGSIWASQEKLLNYVYSNAKNPGLGNDQPGDGYKYRGRGGMHLTGKYNYQQFTNFYNSYCNGSCSNFVQEPGLVASHRETSILSGLWFFSENINKKMTINENTSVDAVTIKINPKKKGIEDRKRLFNAAKEAMKDC